MPFLTNAILQKQKEWDKSVEDDISGEMSPNLTKVTPKASPAGKSHLRDSHIKFQGETLTPNGMKSQPKIVSHKDGTFLNETMQDILEIHLFNLNFSIVFNDVFCVATLASLHTNPSISNKNRNPLDAASKAAESQNNLNGKP
jgi:hypothetical protein